MARQRAIFRGFKSIAGAALIGSGMFILYGNLALSVAWLRHVLGANSSEALGVLPAATLMVSQVLQAQGADHQPFLQDFLQHIFAASWPLLLVTVGTVLSRDTFTDNVNAVHKKDRALVDLESSRSTLK